MSETSSPYLVLARKYRPTSFSTLIGQDAMVQTLANAFKSNRIHHAFILTGVRGVGKTTTARILARAFNFEDETGPHPTLDLAREGVHDRAIIEGRHVDVQEMDAASNTGINDIREIIDSVRYGPVSAPYKVYIIDEVHMLSTAAFNGLLKTLEEPPPYVKFIFATTEIRKVPVTILSRCQRFDLRRVQPEVMTNYLVSILGKETIPFEPEALAMIVRAGEGSVRDNLSLLDQAISHGDGQVSAEAVKAMLGLGDRARTIDLFEAMMQGRIAEALEGMRALYDAGADPETIITDLAELTHLVSRIKVTPDAADDASLTPDERSRGPELAQKLPMRALTRAWQILFKGHEEVSRAANGVQAAEMVLIRLAYASDLPSPDEIIARLANQPLPTGTPSAPMRATATAAAPQALRQPTPRVEAVAAQQPQPDPGPRSYAELVQLADTRRDLLVKHALESELRCISFEPGRIEVTLTEAADPAIVQTLSARLKSWTGRNWMITVSNRAEAVPTLREERQRKHEVARAEAHEDPMVQAILETFPGARVTNVTLREATEATATPELLPPATDDDEEDEL